jgi:hypothetical protein
MALDIEKLKRAQAEVQARMTRGGGGPSMKYWKPQDGNNRVRILPPWTDSGEYAGVFWREVWQHWNVSEDSGPILCPSKTANSEDKECPICDMVDALRGQRSNVEAQELAKDLRAKVAYLMSIVDLSDPVYTAKDLATWKKERPDSEAPFEAGDPKVQVYAATSTIYEQIASIVIANELDITDINEGHNIIITKIGNSDRMKTRYTIQPDLKKTKAPIPANFSMPDLAKIGRFQSFDDMAKTLSEGKAGAFKGASLPANASSHKAAKPAKAMAASAPAVDNGWGMSDDGDDLAAEMRRSLEG